jgi:hypothetical protein
MSSAHNQLLCLQQHVQSGLTRESAMLPSLSNLPAHGISMQAEWYCSEDEDSDEYMQYPDCYHLDPPEREINEMDHLLDNLRTYLDQIHTNGTTPEPVLQGRRTQAALDEFVESAQKTNPDGSAALDEATLTRLALVLNDSGSGVLNVLADYNNAFLALEERGNLPRPTQLIRDGKGPVSRYDVADTVMAAASALLASMERYRAAVYN